MDTAGALRLLRTVRGLRWRQWAYRPLRRAQARLGAPPPPATAEVDASRAEAMAGVWGDAGPISEESARTAAEVLAGRFEFVGHAQALGDPDWLARPVSPLWTYNLHYFDYAADLAWAWRESGDPAYPRRFQALAGAWIEQTAGGRGPGWEPYALSLRAANWMRARLLFSRGLDAGFAARLDASVHGQLAFLRRRLEWHILANHLQKNLHALVLGGLYFTGPQAAEWRGGVARLLWRELDEQVLDDGGHYERSPMYHAIALGDFLEAVALLDACGVAVPAGARERVRAMYAAWTRLSREDGQPHLFNDAAEGIAPRAAWLRRLGERALGGLPAAPAGAWALPRTGYFGFAGGGGERMIVDCGPPGPRYQPGHAHCDALSFELELGGAPVVVDSGTSGYDGDPLRAYARSTRAHNTVQVGGREQSEVWGTFRVGGMATVRAVEWSGEGSAGFGFTGECVPFHSRRATHRRTVTRLGAGRWKVEDRVEGAGEQTVRSYLHLHPRFEARVDGSRVVAVSGDETVVVETWGADRVRVARGEEGPAQGWYSPRFGARLPAPVVELEVGREGGRGFGYEIRLERR